MAALSGRWCFVARNPNLQGATLDLTVAAEKSAGLVLIYRDRLGWYQISTGPALRDLQGAISPLCLSSAVVRPQA